MSDLNRVSVKVNSIENLELNDFVNDKDAKHFKNATVELNGKKYRVSALGSGKIDVVRDRNSFASKFKGMFEHHSSHTNTANAIRDKIISLVSKIRLHNNTLENLNGLFVKEFGENAENKTLEVAHYGFSGNRGKAYKAEFDFNSADANYNKNNKIHFNTIDDYNQYLGIRWDTVSADTIHLINKDIKNGTLDALPPPEGLHRTDDQGKNIETRDKKYNAERLEAWKAHLQENASKLDIVTKLFNYMSSTKKLNELEKKSGWEYDFAKNPDKALKKFIQKNIPQSARLAKGDLKRLVPLFKDYIRIYNLADGDERTANIQHFIKANFRQGKPITGVDDDNYYPHDIKRGCGVQFEDGVTKLEDLFNDILRTAFFRQTSKLGIDFFRKRNVPILFQWADWRGVTLDKNQSSKGIGELKNKWWLKDPSKFAEYQKGESITYSEARHLLKIKKAEQNGEIPNQLKAKLSAGLRNN